MLNPVTKGKKCEFSLADVRNKDVGPAGDSLRNIVTTIRGFSVSELDVRRERSWWEKLIGRAAPFAKFTARFETVQGQIDKVTDDLLHHEHTLLKDIKSLDLLYQKTLAFYDELALYIAAGEAKLAELDATDIPAKEAEVQAAPEGEQVMKAQTLSALSWPPPHLSGGRCARPEAAWRCVLVSMEQSWYPSRVATRWLQ